MQVIPAINESDFETVKKKAQLVAESGLVQWVQLDVTDGSMTESVGWHEAYEVAELPKEVNYEIHLMIKEVEEKLEDWIKSGAKRIIWHLEAEENHLMIKERIEAAGLTAGLAVGYGVNLVELKKIAKEFSFWQVLAVPMGQSGQEFRESALEIIKTIKEENKEAKIEVDGGINKQIAESIKKAGADMVAVSSYIFKSNDPVEVIRQLQAI